MAGKSLVIVESPTKARTIARFLGGQYIVKASNGHIRDLPNNAAEIPLKYKKDAWAKLGVNIADDFAPLYVIPPNKKENVKELKPPSATALQHVQDAADDTSVIHSILAAYIGRQKGLDLLPLFVAQPKQVASHVLCSSAAENH
jgi:hypothetical protein